MGCRIFDAGKELIVLLPVYFLIHFSDLIHRGLYAVFNLLSLDYSWRRDKTVSIETMCLFYILTLHS